MLYTEYLKNLKTCPFCDHQNTRIYQNETAYLIACLAPYHPHHLLVIPKLHVDSFLDLPQAELNDVQSLILLGCKILEKLNYQNYTVFFRQGPSSGKSIGHFHCHLVPGTILTCHQANLPNRRILSPQKLHTTISEITKVLKTLV